MDKAETTTRVVREVGGTKKDPLVSVSLRLKQLAPTSCFLFLLTLCKKREKKVACKHTHTHSATHTHTLYIYTQWEAGEKAKVRQL